MQKRFVYYFVLILFFVSIEPVLSNNTYESENCTDPYTLCPSDILSVTLQSIEVHPGSYDKGGRQNTALELSYYLELGIQGDHRSVLMYWYDKSSKPEFPANFSDKPYEIFINEKYVSMVKSEINLYNATGNTTLDDFYSRINFIVKEGRLIGKSSLCNISLAKPVDNNWPAYREFISLVREANENDSRKAQANINLTCIPNNKSAHLTFKFLFEFERQQLD